MEESGTETTIGELVGVVTTSGTKSLAAFLQIRSLVRDERLEYRLAERIAEYAQLRGIGPGDASGAMALVLARGGPDAQQLLVQRLGQNESQSLAVAPVFLLALGLSDAPDSAVTAELRRLAESAPPAGSTPALFALALAARGDRSGEWLAYVAAAVHGIAGKDFGLAEMGDATAIAELEQSFALLWSICYVVPKLPDTPSLSEEFWGLAEHSPGRLRLLATVAYLNMPGAAVPQARMEQLSVSSPDAQSGDALLQRLAVSLAEARLGRDRPGEVEEALAALGNGYDEGVAFMLPLLADVLATGAARSRVWDRLCSGDASAKRGALVLFSWLGPDAREALPCIDALMSGGDARLAAEARVTWMQIAGLDENGNWQAPPDRPTTTDGWTPLHWAVQAADAASVARLVAEGSDVNAATVGGVTPLGVAIAERNWQVAELLLDKGAACSDLELSDACVALTLAAEKGDQSGVELLTRDPRVIDLENSAGWMSLQAAAAGGQAGVIRFLMGRGARPDAADWLTGRTALHAAAEAGTTGIVRLLLDLGADADATDAEGLTPLDLAVRNGHDDTAELLRQTAASE